MASMLFKIKTMEKVSQYMASADLNFEAKSVGELCADYNIENLNELPTKKHSFYNFLKILGYKYKKVQLVSKNTNNQTLSSLNYFRALLKNLSSNKILVLFFDVSSLSDTSFKKKGWRLINQKCMCYKKFSYNLTHMLTLMSTQHVESFQLIRGNLTNFDLINFLHKSVKRIRVIYPGKQISLVLDNAKMHFTKFFKNFAKHSTITLIHTVPGLPMLHPIEFLFRYLKGSFKAHHSLY